MLYSRLAKKAFSSLLSSHGHHQCHQLQSLSPLLLQLQCSLSTQPKTQQQMAEMPFIAHYLISSFGFPSERALKLSAYPKLRVIRSSDRVNSVTSFFKEIGLNDSQIRSLVSLDPFILAANTQKSMKPRLLELMDAGFVGEILVHLILSNPDCLSRDYSLSRLRFWRNFVGGNNEVFLKVLRRNQFLMTLDIDEYVVPRLNLLKEFGLSDEVVLTLLTWGSGCFVRSLESLKQILEKAEQLVFSRGSYVFLAALRVVSSCTQETLNKKEELFKRTYGWSDEEFSLAVKKCPTILSLSEKNIRMKMDFLVKDVGLQPRSIASVSSLLTYSFTRMVSRHNVLRALEVKGIKKNCKLSSACAMSEKRFLSVYVVPFEKVLCGLREVYTVTCLKKMPV